MREAGEAESALSPFAVEPPDLILLDVRMPSIGGLEICRRTKACENGQPASGGE